MTPFLEFNIGLTKLVNFLLSSKQHITNINNNIKRIEKTLKIVLNYTIIYS